MSPPDHPDAFRCPQCKSRLIPETAGLHCPTCALTFPIVDGIPDFVLSPARPDPLAPDDQIWLDAETVAARDTVYRLCARELKGMSFCIEQIRQRTFAGCRILEVGMGTGHFTRWIAETATPGTAIYAFDLSWPMLARARENTAGHPGITLFRANARGALPF